MFRPLYRSIVRPAYRPLIHKSDYMDGNGGIPFSKDLIIDDLVAESDRPIQPGYALSFDGVDDYIDAPHLSGSETVVSFYGSSTPSISAGQINFTSGTCSDLILSDGTHYKIEESIGTILLDSSGSGNDGSLINGPTWITDPTKPYDYANQEGFTLGTGSNGAAEGVVIPKLDGASTDVFGNELDYTGSAFPIQSVKRNSYCGVFDGVDDYATTPVFPNAASGYIEVVFKLVSGETTAIIAGARSVVSERCYIAVNDAGAEPYIAGGIGDETSSDIVGSTALVYGDWYKARLEWDTDVRLYLDVLDGAGYSLEYDAPKSGAISTGEEFHIGGLNNTGTTSNRFTGEIAYLDIQGDAIFTFSEGYGFRVYDTSGNENHGTVINASTSVQGAGFWAGRQDVYHYNLKNGFSFPQKLTANTSLGSYGSKAVADQVFSGDFEINFLVPEQNNGVKTVGIYYGSAPPGSYSPSVTDTPAFQFFNTFNQIWNNGSIQDGNQTIGRGTVLGIKRVGSTVTMLKNGTVQETFFNEPTDDVYFYVSFDDINRSLEDFRSTQGYLSFSIVEGMDVTTPKRLPADFNGLDPYGFPVTNPATYGDNDSETTLDIYRVAEGNLPAPETNHLSNFEVVEFSDSHNSLVTTSPINTVYRQDISDVEKSPINAFSESLSSSESAVYNVTQKYPNAAPYTDHHDYD